MSRCEACGTAGAEYFSTEGSLLCRVCFNAEQQRQQDRRAQESLEAEEPEQLRSARQNVAWIRKMFGLGPAKPASRRTSRLVGLAFMALGAAAAAFEYFLTEDAWETVKTAAVPFSIGIVVVLRAAPTEEG